MSAPQTPALNAIARELLALLDEQQPDVARMVAGWPDPQAYDRVAAQLDRMRVLSAALFGMNIAWAELLIAHAELVQVLWRVAARDPADLKALAKASERHAHAAATLRMRILWWMPVSTPA